MVGLLYVRARGYSAMQEDVVSNSCVITDIIYNYGKVYRGCFH
jgi:hypothetical protein